MSLEGRTILVVEDEALLSLDIESVLTGAGCQVVGPFSSAAAATASVGLQPLDAALLDINLGAETVYPLADLLHAKGIPFIWTTGHNPDVLPPRYRNRPVVGKPYGMECLLSALSAVIPDNPRRTLAIGA